MGVDAQTPGVGDEWEFTGYIEDTNIPVYRRDYEASVGPFEGVAGVEEALRRLATLLQNEKAIYNYIARPSFSGGRPVVYRAIDIKPHRSDRLVEPPITLFGMQLARSATAGGGMKEGNFLYIESNKKPKSHIVEAVKALAGDETAWSIKRGSDTPEHP